jgi:hypothetical protein
MKLLTGRRSIFYYETKKISKDEKFRYALNA